MASTWTRGTRGRGGALLLAVMLLALPLAAQKNFNQSEKATVEKFKRARARCDKGMEYLEKNIPGKAEREAAASMEILPEYSDAHLLLAMIRYQQGDYGAGLVEIEKAKKFFDVIREFYAVSYQDYISRLREQRDFTANRLADGVAGGLPMYLIREAEIKLERIDEKLRAWKPSVDLDVPAEYHFIHGNILFKLKRFAEARDQYRAAVTADPRHANAWNNLIGILFISGDRAGALDLLGEAEANGVVLNEKLKRTVLAMK